MRKILAVLAAAGMCLALGVGSAEAIHLTNKKAVGWFDPNTPIGGAYWFNEKVGVQAGFGFFKLDPGGDIDGPDASIAFSAAIPIRLAGPETCHFLFRPGLYYETNPVSSEIAGVALDNILSIRADLAAEYFLSHHFSIVGGMGVEYLTENPTDEAFDSASQFRTRPFTLGSVGMYYYFGGDAE